MACGATSRARGPALASPVASSALRGESILGAGSADGVPFSSVFAEGMTMETLDYLLAAVSFGLLAAYHTNLVLKIRRNPLSVTMGLARRIRTLWVRTIMRGRLDILAVQTLRNWTMAATFLASAAILLGLGTFNLAFVAERAGEIPHIAHTVWLLKIAIIGMNFLISFFNFSVALRYFNHTGMMINVLDDAGKQGFHPEAVLSILERGTNHYSIGMRLLYLAIPLSLWLFGTIWLFFSSLALLAALILLDRGVLGEDRGNDKTGTAAHPAE
jgi:uncharacterized membrane protein